MPRFILTFGVVLFCVAMYTICAHAQIISIPIPGSPLSLTVMANPQPLQDLRLNPAATNITMGDDSNVNVPLQFTFPFYGRNFTNSWMYSNGAVNFRGANAPGGFCCSGLPLTTSLNSGYNYSILPLWADLIALPEKNGAHYKLGTSNTMTYGWYNVSEYGVPNNLSSFEVKIDSTGLIDMRFSGALVTYHPVTIGTIGDASRGEFTQNYYNSSGINMASPFQLSTGAVDICIVNPTSSPACPGYQIAMCAINELFTPSCPGYQQAYLTQQCGINSLYDTACPGYAATYLQYQCSLSPLYSSTCEGYAAAYKTQQCDLDGLYARDCPNYAEAYARRYVLNISPTTSYQAGPAAGGDQSSYNSQNSNSGPATMGYSGPGATNVTTTQPVTSISNTGQVSTGVNLTSNSTVNAIISAPPMTGPMATNTNNPVASAIAPVQTQMADGPMATSAPAQRPAESSPEQRSSTASNDGPATDSSTPAPRQSSTSAQASPAPQQSNTQSAPAPTARQELQAKREQAAKAQAVEAGKNLANEMGKAASMEQQISVQNVVLQAMGYSPGFAGYTKGYIPDVAGYKSHTAYANQKNVDNARLSRGLFGATDRLHNDMIESQYQLEK